MWALLVIIVTATGPTSATIYFPEKAKCEEMAAWMAGDMRLNAENWVEHAYIHCMPLREGK